MAEFTVEVRGVSCRDIARFTMFVQISNEITSKFIAKAYVLSRFNYFTNSDLFSLKNN